MIHMITTTDRTSSPGCFIVDPIKTTLGYKATAVSRSTTRNTHISGWWSMRESLAEAGADAMRAVYPGHFTSELQTQEDARCNEADSRRHLSTLSRQQQAATSTQDAGIMLGSTHLKCWCLDGMSVAHSRPM